MLETLLYLWNRYDAKYSKKFKYTYLQIYILSIVCVFTDKYYALKE